MIVQQAEKVFRVTRGQIFTDRQSPFRNDLFAGTRELPSRIRFPYFHLRDGSAAVFPIIHVVTLRKQS